MSPSDIILLVHAASTWFMVGLIWFVQVVHYPGFGGVPERGFVAYTTTHVRRTGWVVGPPMLCEAGCALALVALDASTMSWIGLALLAGIWGTTALVQVPVHHHLNRRRDAAKIRHLVRSNWVRTVLWSARGGLALWMLVRVWEART